MIAEQARPWCATERSGWRRGAVAEARFELTLATSRTAAGDTRADIGPWLTARCAPDTVDTATLLVSELVTNVVVHTTSPLVRVTASCSASTVTVRVDDWADPAPGPAHARPDPLASGGRGLWMVEAMATRWGWAPTADGKQVWFELPRDVPTPGQQRDDAATAIRPLGGRPQTPRI
jgi:hypothetical protein